MVFISFKFSGGLLMKSCALFLYDLSYLAMFMCVSWSKKSVFNLILLLAVKFPFIYFPRNRFSFEPVRSKVTASFEINALYDSKPVEQNRL